MKDIRLAPVITVLLLIVGSVWWFMTFERVTEPVYSGLKGAAREDPLLALRQLLKRSKMRLEEPAVAAGPAAKFDNLPAGGTLLLTDRRYILMSAERVNTIVAWVEAGGHLIVEAEFPGRPDPLLAAFGLGRKDLPRGKLAPGPARPAPAEGEDDDDEHDATNERSKEPAPSSKARARGGSEITEVTLPDGKRPLKVQFRPYQNLDTRKATGFQVTSDPTGQRLATGAYGAGRVTAISNFDFLTYRGTYGIRKEALQPSHLGKYDHAELVMRLVRLNPNHDKTALRLVRGDEDLSLWTWLVDHAASALASLTLLLMVWLWRVVPRFGPLISEPPPADQKLSSHLVAVGRFYWKHMQPAEIYAKLRAAFLQRLTDRRPGIARTHSAERNAQLAQLAGVRAEAVARALDHPANSVGELIRTAVLLQRLSQKL